MSHQLRRPIFLILTGLPGSGKTYLSHHLSQELNINKVQTEYVRSAILSQSTLKSDETNLLQRINFFLVEEFLRLQLSLVGDLPAQTNRQRLYLAKLARHYKVLPIIIYQQVDRQTAWLRCQSRQAQVSQQHTLNLDQTTFDLLCRQLEAPLSSQKTKLIVVSGLHPFSSQIQTIRRHLLEMRLIKKPTSSSQEVVKPGLVNLIAAQNQRLLAKSLSISLKKTVNEKD